MKKIYLSAVFSLFLINNALSDISLGISGTMSALNADGKEVVSNTTTHTKSDKVYMGYASIFGEAHLGSNLRLGLSYVPYSMESETTESTHISKSVAQGGTGEADRSQKVQVDIEDLTTLYLSYHYNNFFGKVGIIQADLITNESLDTGSTYGNADLKGTMYGAGFEKDLDNGMFLRGEVSYNDFDNIKLTSTANSNTIDVTGISGTSAAISIGKTF